MLRCAQSPRSNEQPAIRVLQGIAPFVYALWLDVALGSALESSLLHAQPNLDRR
jgi:hypothetical protein